jgi:hypothetical protein
MPIVAEYEYIDESGTVCGKVERVEPGREGRRKEFFPHHFDGSKFVLGLNGKPFPLYHADEIAQAIAAGQTVFFVEGEGKADALRAALQAAKSRAAVTTIAGGCKAPFRDEHLAALSGAPKIVFLIDSDEPGRASAMARADVLARRYTETDVRVIDLFPGRDDGSDVADWLREGHKLRELATIIAAASTVVAQQTSTIVATSETRLLVTRADAIVIKRVEWLAQDRIPRGGMTLFDGPGGIGKTQFLTGVIAAATRGRDFFTNAEIAPVNALVVGIEDQRAIIAARLRLYGADMTRVHLVDAAQVGGKQVTLMLPDHIGILERMVVELDIGFVYVDALFSHIALSGDGKMSQHVRSALAPIGEMCQRRDIAFAAMRHWTKAAGSALSRAMGSVEFTNFARSVFTFGLHPTDDGLIVCAHTKTNSSKKAGAVGFRCEVHYVEDDHGQPWEVAISAGVAPCDGVTSDDLTMRLPSDPDEKGSAADWLQDYLADGSMHSSESVQQAAAKARVCSRTTLKRAAVSLGVVMTRTQSFPSTGMWQLPPTSRRNYRESGQQSDHLSQVDDDRSDSNQWGHSQPITQVMSLLGETVEAGAPQTITPQVSASQITVGSEVIDGSGIYHGRTGKTNVYNDPTEPVESAPAEVRI